MSTKVLKEGPRGGEYYMRKGKKIYVARPEAAGYEMRRAAQPTTGWKERAPKKGRERARLYDECDAKGKTCFLKPNANMPSQSGFPICPACRDPNVPCSCEVDCGGLTAALVRARQWKYEDVAKRAIDIREKNCPLTEGQIKRQEQIGGRHPFSQNGGARQYDPSLPGVYYEPTGRFSQAYCPQPPPCPQNQPLRYKMRGQTDKYCCRGRPKRRVGPRQANPWIQFLKQHKGQGLSRDELQRMYKQSK